MNGSKSLKFGMLLSLIVLVGAGSLFASEETPVVTPEETPVVTPEETPVVTPEETPVVTPVNADRNAVIRLVAYLISKLRGAGESSWDTAKGKLGTAFSKIGDLLRWAYSKLPGRKLSEVIKEDNEDKKSDSKNIIEDMKKNSDEKSEDEEIEKKLEVKITDLINEKEPKGETITAIKNS